LEDKAIRLGISMSKKLLEKAKEISNIYDLTFSEFVRQSIIEKIERSKGDSKHETN
jgi:metal-responsive CopG/Arc/MetJ family transcriptional regulator